MNSLWTPHIYSKFCIYPPKYEPWTNSINTRNYILEMQIKHVKINNLRKNNGGIWYRCKLTFFKKSALNSKLQEENKISKLTVKIVILKNVDRYWAHMRKIALRVIVISNKNELPCVIVYASVKKSTKWFSLLVKLGYRVKSAIYIYVIYIYISKSYFFSFYE